MGRPPSVPDEKKTRIVLAEIAGELTIADAARREKVSEQSIVRWKAVFLEGRAGPFEDLDVIRLEARADLAPLACQVA